MSGKHRFSGIVLYASVWYRLLDFLIKYQSIPESSKSLIYSKQIKYSSTNSSCIDLHHRKISFLISPW
jgi:hypothetical protein